MHFYHSASSPAGVPFKLDAIYNSPVHTATANVACVVVQVDGTKPSLCWSTGLATPLG